jgi:hypothetical protein
MTLLQIKTWFETDQDGVKGKKFDSLKDYRTQWDMLSDTDKDQLKAGLSDGTFNY